MKSKSEFCNDCKYYSLLNSSGMVGVCAYMFASYKGGHTGIMPRMPKYPWDSCIDAYKKSIHNQYGIESAEEMELYKRNRDIKHQLSLDIYNYKVAKKIASEIQHFNEEVRKSLIPPETKN